MAPGTEHLEHDLFLLMLNLSQLRQRERILALFIDSINGAQDALRLCLLAEGDSPRGEILEVAANGQRHCRLLLVPASPGPSGNGQETGALVRNAVQMLAVILDNRAQEEMLAGERARLEAAVAERTRELRGSEERYRSLVEVMPCGLVVHDFQGHVVEANRMARDLLAGKPGATLEEAFGEAGDPCVTEAGEPVDFRELTSQQVLSTGEPVFGVLMGVRRPGEVETRWVVCNSAPIFAPGSDTPAGAVTAFADITEQKRAREAAEESRTRFQMLFNSSADALFLLDPHSRPVPGLIVDCNGAACEMNGYTRGELVGQPIALLNEPLTPRAPSASEPPTYLAQLRIAGRLRHTRSHVRKDGSVYSVDASNSLVSMGGRELILALERDMTEYYTAQEKLRASEVRYRDLFENAPIALWEMDFSGAKREVDRLAATGIADLEAYFEEHPLVLKEVFAKGRVLNVNQAALNLYRARSVRELVQGGRGLGAQELGPLPLRAMASLPRPAIRLSGHERRMAMDGSPLVVLTSWAAAPGHEETYDRVYISEVDTTEQRRLEDQLRQSQKMEAIGQLAGGVAHDFNNLLTAITGYADLGMDRLPTDSPLVRHLGEIRKAADRASALTRQLLAFSRKQILDPRVLDLNAVVADMDKMLRRIIGEHIQLKTLQYPNLAKVKADPGQLEQVLMNLVVNARDAMPEGGILTVETGHVVLDEAYARVYPEAKTGPHVMLCVSDTGHGMDQATLSHIFEPFFTTKPQGQGTGLGLSTVYGIVRQSEGTVWVYSEPGLGSTFKVYLPAVLDDTTQGVAALTPTEAPRGSERILVVEDEAAVLTLVSEILQAQGYDVASASDGRAALDLCQQNGFHFDMLLTDVIMPDMNGHQLADALRKRDPGLRVLFVSGYTDHAILHHGFLEEGVAFLQKPFNPSELARKVRAVLDAKDEG
jgi:PAS domain S-box-containing protein